MLRLKLRQREILIEKGADMANLAIGGLVFGQFLRSEPFSLPIAIGGIAVWTIVMGVTIVLAGEAQ